MQYKLGGGNTSATKVRTYNSPASHYRSPPTDAPDLLPAKARAGDASIHSLDEISSVPLFLASSPYGARPSQQGRWKYGGVSTTESSVPKKKKENEDGPRLSPRHQRLRLQKPGLTGRLPNHTTRACSRVLYTTRAGRQAGVNWKAARCTWGRRKGAPAPHDE